jgi:hypothetical protein
VVSKTGLVSDRSVCGTYMDCSSLGFFGTARPGDKSSSVEHNFVAVHWIGLDLLLRNYLPALGRFLLP